MYIPEFVRTKKLNTKFTNLMLNCNTADEMYDWLLHLNIESGEAVNGNELRKACESFSVSDDYTLLSMYYFVQSKNDPENELKQLLTKYVKKN